MEITKARPTGSRTQLCGLDLTLQNKLKMPSVPFVSMACGSLKSSISRDLWAPSTLSQLSGNLVAHCVVVCASAY